MTDEEVKHELKENKYQNNQSNEFDSYSSAGEDPIKKKKIHKLQTIGTYRLRKNHKKWALQLASGTRNSRTNEVDWKVRL